MSERESERAIACVSLGKNGTSPVMFGADVYCRLLKLWNKVSSRQESVPVSFRPRTRPTAGHSEGCYPPRKDIGPGGNVSPVLPDYGLGAKEQERCNIGDHEETV